MSGKEASECIADLLRHLNVQRIISICLCSMFIFYSVPSEVLDFNQQQFAFGRPCNNVHTFRTGNYTVEGDKTVFSIIFQGIPTIREKKSKFSFVNFNHELRSQYRRSMASSCSKAESREAIEFKLSKSSAFSIRTEDCSRVREKY